MPPPPSRPSPVPPLALASPPPEDQDREVDAVVPLQAAFGEGEEDTCAHVADRASNDGNAASETPRTRSVKQAFHTPINTKSRSSSQGELNKNGTVDSLRSPRSEADAHGGDRADIFGASRLQTHRAFEPGFAHELTEEVQDAVHGPSTRSRLGALARTRSGRFRASSMRFEPSKFAILCDRILKVHVVQGIMITLTIGILFVSDFFQIATEVGSDKVLIVILWICVCLFGLEWVMQVMSSEFQKPRYNFSLFFFLDLIATLSILIDIIVLEGNNLSDNGPIARAARAARIGTRAGRSVRLLRLLRFLRLVRIIRFIKVLLTFNDSKIKKRRESNEAEEALLSTKSSEVTTRADTIGAQIGATTTRKVVIMTLILLLVLPVLEPQDDKSGCNAEMVELLESLYTSDDVNGDCDAMRAEVEPWFRNELVPFSQSEQSGLTRNGLMFAQVSNCILYSNPNRMGVVDMKQTYLSTLRRGTEIQAIPCDAVFADRDDDGVDDRSASYLLYDYVEEEVESAKFSMGFTVVVIITLIGFSLIFSQDAENFANQLVRPISQLMQDMARTAKLQLELVSKPEDLYESSVYEVRKLQAAFINLNGAVHSFARFMPLEVVRHFLSIGAEAKLGVGQRNVTIFFSDIVGFATICENHSPVDVLDLLREYFECMVSIIVDEEGTMLEFIGDAILAIWNAPNSVPDHAIRACEAALRMQLALQRLQEQWAAEGKPQIGIRCGLHSADVFVGNLGSKMRMKYGVLGDGVNLASRLEELNKRYLTEILISEDVLVQPGVKEHFLLRPLDRVVVKGRVKPTPVYEVLATNANASEEVRRIATYSAQVMEAYIGRHFDQALESLDEIHRMKDSHDPAGDVLRKRCVGFLSRPPPADWDGAEVLKEKTFGAGS